MRKTLKAEVNELIARFAERLTRYPYYLSIYLKKIKKYINNNVKDKTLARIINQNKSLMYAGLANYQINKYAYRIKSRVLDENNIDHFITHAGAIDDDLDLALKNIIDETKIRIKSICKEAKKHK